MKNYFSHKQLVLVIGALFSLPLFFLSCSKEALSQKQPLPLEISTTYGFYDFKATVTLTPTANTDHYDVFVFSNGEYSQKVKTILPSEIKNGKYSFVFHLEPVMCDGKVTVDTRLTIKGHIQEWRPGNNIWAVDDRSIVIERCKSLQ